MKAKFVFGIGEVAEVELGGIVGERVLVVVGSNLVVDYTLEELNC